MRPLKKNIFIDYKPEMVHDLGNGILIFGEDSFDFFEVIALSVGTGCKEVEDKQKILIRKESIFQAEVGLDWVYMTREDLVLKINGYPAGNKVVIRPQTEQKTAGGLIIPIDTEKETHRKGIVLAVGPDCTEVSVGDHVILEKYSGLEYKDELIVTESEILAVLCT